MCQFIQEYIITWNEHKILCNKNISLVFLSSVMWHYTLYRVMILHNLISVLNYRTQIIITSFDKYSCVFSTFFWKIKSLIIVGFTMKDPRVIVLLVILVLSCHDFRAFCDLSQLFDFSKPMSGYMLQPAIIEDDQEEQGNNMYVKMIDKYISEFYFKL